jgi:hypothetical protein
MRAMKQESALTLQTDNTNSKNLELYTVLGKYEDTGFPLSYCLLSTASAFDVQKWTKALLAWGKHLRDQYGLIPQFVHTDKDMAEIGMVHNCWAVKLQLCWWHLQKAVRERLVKAKLSTTPYNITHAHFKFQFIDRSFVPPG